MEELNNRRRRRLLRAPFFKILDSGSAQNATHYKKGFCLTHFKKGTTHAVLHPLFIYLSSCFGLILQSESVPTAREEQSFVIHLEGTSRCTGVVRGLWRYLTGTIMHSYLVTGKVSCNVHLYMANEVICTPLCCLVVRVTKSID